MRVTLLETSVGLQAPLSSSCWLAKKYESENAAACPPKMHGNKDKT